MSETFHAAMQFLRDDSGAALVEFALALSVLGLAAYAGFEAIAGGSSTALDAQTSGFQDLQTAP